MSSKQQYKPVDLHYQLWVPKHHDPELSPIIFLHGVATTHKTWDKVASKIADITKRTVYALDLRNHGKSEWSEHNTLHHQGVDIENFLSENGISKCIPVGHSLGGKIALFLALMKPELVEKVVAEEVSLSDPPVNELEIFMEFFEIAKKIVKLQLSFEEADVRRLFAKMIEIKLPHMKNISVNLPIRRKLDGTMEFDFNLDVTERTFRDKSAFHIDLSKCKKFDGPLLVIHGERSYFNVGKDTGINDFFPNAEYCIFKTHEHILHAESPDEYIKYLSSFLNK